MQETIDKRPEVVQCFVDGSAKGWYNYLYGDNKAANEMIKKDNPDITDEQIAFSIKQMKDFGIVDSGDTEKLGIGAMTDERIAKLLRQDGQGQGRSRRPRHQEGLHARLREQGRRARPEEVNAARRHAAPVRSAFMLEAMGSGREPLLALRDVGKTFLQRRHRACETST